LRRPERTGAPGRATALCAVFGSDSSAAALTRSSAMRAAEGGTGAPGTDMGTRERCVAAPQRGHRFDTGFVGSCPRQPKHLVSEGGLQPLSVGLVPVHEIVCKAEPPRMSQAPSCPIGGLRAATATLLSRRPKCLAPRTRRTTPIRCAEAGRGRPGRSIARYTWSSSMASSPRRATSQVAHSAVASLLIGSIARWKRFVCGRAAPLGDRHEGSPGRGGCAPAVLARALQCPKRR
jgi:hypothetical protein